MRRIGGVSTDVGGVDEMGRMSADEKRRSANEVGTRGGRTEAKSDPRTRGKRLAWCLSPVKQEPRPSRLSEDGRGSTPLGRTSWDSGGDVCTMPH